MELTPDRMIRNLKYVSKLYEKKFYGFGEIRISDMVDDCIKMIESQQKQIEELQKQLDAARNELCYKCGRYKEAHKGACCDCKWERKWKGASK